MMDIDTSRHASLSAKTQDYVKPQAKANPMRGVMANTYTNSESEYNQRWPMHAARETQVR
jgi:hypothetical protein